MQSGTYTRETRPRNRIVELLPGTPAAAALEALPVGVPVAPQTVCRIERLRHRFEVVHSAIIRAAEAAGVGVWDLSRSTEDLIARAVVEAVR